MHSVFPRARLPVADPQQTSCQEVNERFAKYSKRRERALVCLRRTLTRSRSVVDCAWRLLDERPAVLLAPTGVLRGVGTLVLRGARTTADLHASTVAAARDAMHFTANARRRDDPATNLARITVDEIGACAGCAAACSTCLGSAGTRRRNAVASAGVRRAGAGTRRASASARAALPGASIWLRAVSGFSTTKPEAEH